MLPAMPCHRTATIPQLPANLSWHFWLTFAPGGFYRLLCHYLHPFNSEYIYYPFINTLNHIFSQQISGLQSRGHVKWIFPGASVDGNIVSIPENLPGNGPVYICSILNQTSFKANFYVHISRTRTHENDARSARFFHENSLSSVQKRGGFYGVTEYEQRIILSAQIQWNLSSFPFLDTHSIGG